MDHCFSLWMVQPYRLVPKLISRFREISLNSSLVFVIRVISPSDNKKFIEQISSGLLQDIYLDAR